RLARGNAEAVAEARSLFVAGREAPTACDAVFASLVASGSIAEEPVFDRIRRLLALNQGRDAKRANALVIARHRLDERKLDRAAADPGRYLARDKSSLVARGPKEIVVYAVTRLARSRPDEAAERLVAAAPAL